MNLEQAITTALEYEGRVHRTYSEAVESAEHDGRGKVFKTLCDEEMEHIKYLRERLEEWRSTGTVTVAKLDTVLVPKAAIEACATKLSQRLESGGREVRGPSSRASRRPSMWSVETSAFYKKMVATLDDDGRRLFERFVEIEEGHVAIVQAEMDMVSGTGFWFDTAEFSLEKA